MFLDIWKKIEIFFLYTLGGRRCVDQAEENSESGNYNMKENDHFLV